jgi:hypothetical protein
MGCGTRARIETPGGLGAHSSLSVSGTYYPRPSHRERCGAENDGGGQIHGAPI